MKENRIGYIMLVIILLVMLFMTGQPFLAYAVVLLVLLAAAMLILLFVDAANISSSLNIAGSGQFGKELTYVLRVGSRHNHMFVTRSVIVNFEIYNKMFGSTSYKTLMFELNNELNECKVVLTATECGEVVLKCNSLYVVDMLNLFRIKAKPFKAATTIIYPKHMGISIERSDIMNGESVKEGNIQNKKGTDSSTIYDIREYHAGDDVRSIHWKLSEKTDKLVVREASEPSHYDVVIIPDFAHFNGDKEVTIDELNTAVAITAEVAEQLVIQKVHFCMLIPGEQGLNELYVSNASDYEKMLAQCMCIRILKQSGSGLEYFITEHRQLDYTRMIIISAGRYVQNLTGLEKYLGITIINAVQEAERMHIDEHEGLEVVDIPAADDTPEKYHIIC